MHKVIGFNKILKMASGFQVLAQALKDQGIEVIFFKIVLLWYCRYSGHRTWNGNLRCRHRILWI